MDSMITVYGIAEPAGSKTAGVVYRKGRPVLKNGRVLTFVRDANAKAKPWKERVAQAAGEQWGYGMIDGPCVLELTFYRTRNKGDFGTGRNEGRIRPGAPAYPIVAPDLTKLIRGVEDALIGICYRDDAQVVEQHTKKLYGDPARVEISVYPAAATTAADLGICGEVVSAEQLVLAA